MQPRFRPWGPGPRSLCLSFAWFFVLGALAAGCGSSPSQPPVIIHPGPGSLRIVPDSADVQTGTQITFQAEVKDSLGHVVTAPSVHWLVADTAVAAVDSVGAVTARALGRTRIEARTATLRDTAFVRVVAGPVGPVAVEVSPAAATFLAGDREPFVAVARDAGGGFVDAAITWTSDNPAVAGPPDSLGEVAMKSPGTVHLTAHAGAVSGTATVQVLDGGAVSTVAGTGSPGTQDGAALSATFEQPLGLAVDSLGALYISEARKDRIRVLESGVVRTLAGGETGYLDSVGAAAQFKIPLGLAIGPGRRVYVADRGNHAIRRIDPDGRVTTVAGAPYPGFIDGPDSVARFREPAGIAVGADGVVYVADLGNSVIRKISVSGFVSTLAGIPGESGYRDGLPGTLSEPVALTLSPGDTALYVVDRVTNMVRRVSTATGEITTIAGSGSVLHLNGPGPGAGFNQPYGLALGPDGWIYVSDSGNHAIRAVAPGGYTTTVTGSASGAFQDGTAAQSTWGFTAGMVLRSGSLYVLDAGNLRLRKIEGTLHIDVTPSLAPWAEARLRRIARARAASGWRARRMLAADPGAVRR